MATIYSYPKVTTVNNQDLFVLSKVNTSTGVPQTKNVEALDLKNYIVSQGFSLNFLGDSGTGAVNIDTQNLTISGTSNEIETSASSQTLQIGLPNSVAITNDLTVGTDLTVGNDIQLNNDAQVDGSLTVNNLTQTETLQVDANALISGILTMEDEIDMSTNRIINLADPTAAQSAATKAYVDSQAGATSLNGLTDASTVKGGFNGGNNTENLILGQVASNLPNLDTTSSFGGNIILQPPALSNPTNLSSGYRNYLIGLGTGTSLTTGNSNIAIGKDALNDSVTGGGSVAIGTNALGLNTATGTTGNTAVGSGAAVNSTTGEKITSIGAGSGYLSFPGTGDNITTIGYGAVASSSSVSNEVTLGNSSVTALRCAVTSITSLSDERDKKDITDLEYGLDFIESLQPKQFVWDNRTETAVTKDEEGNEVTEEIHSANKGKKDFGFIAQDVQTLDNDILRLVYDENPDKLEMSYGKLVPILVKAVKELSDKVKVLEM